MKHHNKQLSLPLDKPKERAGDVTIYLQAEIERAVQKEPTQREEPNNQMDLLQCFLVSNPVKL
jgi:hypothetical protein